MARKKCFQVYPPSVKRYTNVTRIGANVDGREKICTEITGLENIAHVKRHCRVSITSLLTSKIWIFPEGR